ncbi:NAD-dependent epimerase/dehydratase family protein [Pseudomonas sp. UL073]|uniref:NAD-dependent epimerase/dehydratase family protein n=1 Tax=Zestomonas insulae TaxID=2809017 RepID=A0ABS2IJU4_9GAMM|nr:NAD-dependent epimerase/dehydratase family protein [Pseudomonas insulae]MBM7063327.1 NAD-dependent epimerase/dehydratase family protein [Pseudomonas insulae]
MTASPSLLIAGCGDVGSRLARRALALGWRVHGLRRQVEALPAGVLPVAADLGEAARPAAWPHGELDYLVYCAAATRYDEAGYRLAYVDGLARVLDWLAQAGQRPRRLLFVSSSGVYGQQGGEWIDEVSPAEAGDMSSVVMREAERLALGSGHPASVVRLTGIYGPGRNWLLNQVREGQWALAQPPVFTNRIHAEDAAGLLACLLEAEQRGAALDDCYLGVDDEPAALHEVVEWLRGRLDVAERAAEAGMRRSGSKRCSNARARGLGWVPQYPSYREGYAAVLADEG